MDLGGLAIIVDQLVTNKKFFKSCSLAMRHLVSNRVTIIIEYVGNSI